MTSDHADEELLARLGALIPRMTELPAEQRDFARDLFVWRTVDAELAELAEDSLLDLEPTGQRTRAGTQPRLLTFAADGLTIEAEVDTSPGGRRLIGQIVPAGVADVALQSAEVQAQTRADGRGRFVLPLPGREVRMRMRCVVGQRTVETAWVLV